MKSLKGINKRIKSVGKKSAALSGAKKKLAAMKIDVSLQKSGMKKKILTSYNSGRKKRATEYLQNKKSGNKAGVLQARKSLMSDRNLMRSSGVSRSGFNRTAKRTSMMRPMQSPIKRRPF
jgi:hypothetical protein